MSRTPRNGPQQTAQDLQHLLRILHRAELDETRAPERRDRLVAHLRGAVAILSDADRAGSGEERPREPCPGIYRKWYRTGDVVPLSCEREAGHQGSCSARGGGETWQEDDSL